MTDILTICATDTNAGKTFVTRLIYTCLGGRGKAVTVFKPIQTGYPEDNDLSYCGGVPLVSFRPACSPHLAAELAGTEIDIPALAAQIRKPCLVETAGGLFTPLRRPDRTNLDLIRLLDSPVLLVVPNKLGCVNHALLSLEALAVRKIPCLGFVMNAPQPGTAGFIEKDNPGTIADFSGVPCLGEIGFGASVLPAPLLEKLAAVFP